MDQDSLKSLFLTTYDEHADPLYRFCLFKVSDPERAQDLVQEVFTRYWQALRSGEVVAHPRAYLYTLARNRIIDWYRRRKEESLDALQDRGVDVIGSTAADIEQGAQIRELLAAVAELDERSREAFLLRHVEGWPPEEIAAFTGDTANAISVRINRAAKKVQARLRISP